MTYDEEVKPGLHDEDELTEEAEELSACCDAYITDDGFCQDCGERA